MKVLFLSVTAGNGHNSCAKAVEEYIKEKGTETISLDLYSYIHKMLGKTVSDIYSFSISKTPKLFGTLYNMEESTNAGICSLMDNVNRLACKKITDFIDENEINTVITTHVFGAQLLTRLKKKGKINVFTVGVVTDYTIHPHWEDTNMDYYVIADKGLVRQCVIKGIPEEKLLPIGIPINLKYTNRMSKSEARKKLGFDENKPLIFIIMGSMGYGNISEIISEIDGMEYDYQIAIACGSNTRAKNQIMKKTFSKPVSVYGFISNVDEFMDAADVIITKPGGLTVTESLAKGLPMVYVSPIPGQEIKNIDFLVNNGVGVYVTKGYSVADALDQIFRFPERIEEMKSAIRRIAKPEAAKVLGEIVIDHKKSNGDAV